MPKEIITLQLGHYANFVGAHFWNLQEASFSYDHKKPTSKEVDLDVLHREGQTARGESTFTPRLVLCDYRGSLKSLQNSGGLYDGYSDETNHLAWNGTTSTEKSPTPQLNKYLEEVHASQKVIPVVENEIPKRRRQQEYDLEQSVAVWSDFLGVLYHPRSINSLNNFWLNDETQGFDVFGIGVKEYKNQAVRDPLEDSIRHFVEESENLQGFQVLVDAHDGFSGVGSSLLEHLAEEYRTKSVLVYPLIPSPISPDNDDARKDFYRLFDLALTLSGSSEDSPHTAYVPLSLTSKLTRPKKYVDRLPLASFQHIPYHTSAVLAGAVDSISLVNRLSSDEFVHLRDVVDAITVHQRKVAAMSTMLPFPFHETDSLFSSLKAIDAEFLPVSSLTPHVTTPLIDSQNRCYAQVMSLRGVPKERWKCTPEEIQSHRLSYEVANMPASRLFENFMSSYCPNTFGIGRVVEFPCHTRVPFPQFFAETVSTNGLLNPDGNRQEDVKRIPVMAGVHSTDKVADLLTELTSACKKENLNKYLRNLDSDFECDEYKESFERLETLTERYRET